METRGHQKMYGPMSFQVSLDDCSCCHKHKDQIRNGGQASICAQCGLQGEKKESK